MTSLDVLTSSKTDCWNTPPAVLEDVYTFFGGEVGLDPCSNSLSSPSVRCTNQFVESDDGLTKQWDYDTVFMNHPYSMSKLWIPYAKQQWRKYNNEMLLLVKVDVSTRWWRHISDRPWLAYNRRLKFGDGKQSAPFMSAMVYLGHDLDRFRDVFCMNGTIYVPI